MDISSLLSLVVVVGILIFSLSASFGWFKDLKETIEKILNYFRHIPSGTYITLSLLLGSVVLAIIASI